MRITLDISQDGKVTVVDATGTPPPGTGGGEPTPAVRLIGPGQVVLPGAPQAVVFVDEPINVGWVPSLVGGVLGTTEPSNGPAGYAKRSAKGWPWHYAMGANGPTGDRRIAFSDWTFATEEELEANIQAAKLSRANIDKYMAQLAATPIDGLSNTKVADLMQDPAGLALMRHFDNNARHRLHSAGKPINNLEVFRKLLDGSHDDMNRAINASYDNAQTKALLDAWHADTSELVEYLAASPWQDLIGAYNRWISSATA